MTRRDSVCVSLDCPVTAGGVNGTILETHHFLPLKLSDLGLPLLLSSFLSLLPLLAFLRQLFRRTYSWSYLLCFPANPPPPRSLPRRRDRVNKLPCGLLLTVTGW